MTRRRLQVAAVALAVLAVGAGCGAAGGSDVATLTGDSGTTPTEEVSDTGTPDGDRDKAFEDAMLAYARCMREHGVDMPDPTFGGSGEVGIAIGGPGEVPPESQTFEDAQEACKPIMDDATRDMPKPSPEEQAKMRDDMLAFTRCMREHGIDMPDPTFDDGGRMTITGGGSTGAAPGGTEGQPTPPPEAGQPPRIDPKFEAASKACSKDGKGGGVLSGPVATSGSGT